MKIALDYDLTFSLDPAFWQSFALRAALSGHEVRIVTARDDRYDRTAPLAEVENMIPVVYCRGIAKKWYLEHFSDFAPDVWIDDKPESILANSTAAPEVLAEWRASRTEGPALDNSCP